ncbi:hypothetical protein P691DRAFT_669371 [Macrolepiota fuliginosa MF-IS2]|uniref:Uncharacterized protein n=1 Tax=Macrolepiota fuliginosa MF-IS2 TaxID=1400762 RepID=A0A9P6C4J0_9AGAR|nr:hypothetical protein P691DRAFT_669371 [Macrolepiota fuliginosa MF-IS2]
MSLSVDDLVSSLSSSHIGQEAIDLATLHAQLAQSLFAQSSSGPSARQLPRGHPERCTTPIARTPSSNYSFSHMATRASDDMDDDERMVEELLMPSSPVATPSNPQFQYSSAPQQSMSPAPNHLSSYFPVSAESSAPQSVFTSTDPFYLAAMQQQQQQQQSASFFAQNGRLAQNSPFFVRQPPQHRENHHPLTIDTHSIFASAAY